MNDVGTGGGVASAVPDALRAGALCIRTWTSGVQIRASGLLATAPETSRGPMLGSIGSSLRGAATRHEDIADFLESCARAFLDADMSRDLADAISIGLGEEGYEERRTNRTKYGEWFGGDGEPWCAMFVSWCFDQAGIPLPKAQTSKGFAAVRQGWDYAVKHDQLVWKPKPGDIFLIRTGKSGKGHTGIVVSVDDKTGQIHTIEGNTNADGGREGTEVLRKTRSIASINQGFWRPFGEISDADRKPAKGASLTWPVTPSQKKTRKKARK
jgi:uncharacterized protein (TIGR02594 family)